MTKSEKEAQPIYDEKEGEKTLLKLEEARRRRMILAHLYKETIGRYEQKVQAYGLQVIPKLAENGLLFDFVREIYKAHFQSEDTRNDEGLIVDFSAIKINRIRKTIADFREFFQEAFANHSYVTSQPSEREKIEAIHQMTEWFLISLIRILAEEHAGIRYTLKKLPFGPEYLTEIHEPLLAKFHPTPTEEEK